MKTSRYHALLTIIALTCLTLTGCDTNTTSQALGTLAKDRYLAVSARSATIDKLTIKEGNQVKKGELLAQLDDTDAKLNVANAKAQIAKSMAQLELLELGNRPQQIAEAKAKVDSMQASATNANKNWQRIARLYKQGAQSRAAYDNANQQNLQAIANLQQALENYSLLKAGARPQEITEAKERLEEAKIQLAQANKNLSDYQILAPISGRIDTIFWRQGERISAGSAIAVLLNDQQPYARVYVPEPKRLQMKVGQSLNIHIDGQKQPLIGKVLWISNQANFTPYYALSETDRARLMYEMKVSLPHTDESYPVGLPVQVELP